MRWSRGEISGVARWVWVAYGMGALMWGVALSALMVSRLRLPKLRGRLGVASVVVIVAAVIIALMVLAAIFAPFVAPRSAVLDVGHPGGGLAMTGLNLLRHFRVEIDPAAGVRLRSWRVTPDGQEHQMQDGSTADMIWGIPELIAYITGAVTREPGDVISTGTPSGSLLPPTKLYFARPVQRAAGAGSPAGSSGA